MAGIGKNRVSPEPLEDPDEVEQVHLPDVVSPRKQPQQPQTMLGWDEERRMSMQLEDASQQQHQQQQNVGGDRLTDKEDRRSFEELEEELLRQPEDEHDKAQREDTSNLLFHKSGSGQQHVTSADPEATDGRYEEASTSYSHALSSHPVEVTSHHRQEQSDSRNLWYTSSDPNEGVNDIKPVTPEPPTAFRMEEMRKSERRPEKEEPLIIGASENEEGGGCCSVILTGFSYLLVIIFFPFSLVICIKVVQEYERAVIFRLGRLLSGGAKGPGIFFVLPCIEDYTKIDLRTITFDIPPQEVLTRDSVTVSVDAVVYYRIYNPTVSVANVANAAHSTQLLAQTTLRNVLGTKNLGEILSDRDQISESMQTSLDDATDRWGIKVERVEIKDVRLPIQLQRAMAAEAEAAREARAKVIAAEGEQKASLALKEASDIISGTPTALQLRYLQTLNSISAEKNSTIIFPLPIDLLGSFIK